MEAVPEKLEVDSSGAEKVTQTQTSTSKFSQNDEKARRSIKRLYISIGISSMIMIAEIAGGAISDSIAIITDAFHILADLLGFVIIIISMQFTRRQATHRMTFGYHRAEVIGSLLSIALIWGLTGWLISESIDRLIHPQPIEGLIMLVTACGAVLGNFLMGMVLVLTDPDGHGHSHGLLHHGHTHGHHHGQGHDHHDHDHDDHDHDHHDHDHHDHNHHDHNHHDHDHNHHDHENYNSGCANENRKIEEINKTTLKTEFEKDEPVIVKPKKKMSLNIRAAFIHILGDGIQSIGVVIAGVIVYVKPEYTQADPVCTLLFCALVISTTIPILRDIIKILMEASPEDISIDKIIIELKKVEEIIDIHDIHLWSLSSGKVSMSCHLISNSPESSLDKATKILKDVFSIGHITIQIETGTNSINFECQNDLH